MNEPSARASARILQFRSRPASGSSAPRGRAADVSRLRAPVSAMVDIDGWYHAAAVADEHRPGKR